MFGVFLGLRRSDNMFASRFILTDTLTFKRNLIDFLMFNGKKMDSNIMRRCIIQFERIKIQFKNDILYFWTTKSPNSHSFENCILIFGSWNRKWLAKYASVPLKYEKFHWNTLILRTYLSDCFIWPLLDAKDIDTEIIPENRGQKDVTKTNIIIDE